MSESTNVGTIVANLKIDSSDWNRELAQAETRAHSLGRANPKIRVETAGTKQAVAELAAVEVAEKKVSASSAALARMREQGRTVAIAQALADKESIKPKMDFTEWTKRSTEATKQDTAAKEKTSESNRKVDSTAKQAGGSIHLLYSALAMLAPAAVPIAGVAAAGAAALGALGVSGVLAVVGVKKAMEDGTQTGNRYASGIALLKRRFDELASTSAEGMLAGFNRGVNTLDSYMPSLNRQMGDFSRVTGNVAANGLTGMLGMFTTLDPVMRGFAGYLGQLSDRFATIGQSNGLRSFGDYALAVMPQVMATIEALVRGAGNLLAALSPLGGVALTSLKVISDVLAGIPTDVLTILISGALGAYAAFATWSAVIPIIQSFGLMLNMSLGPIGLVVAGVGALIGVMVGSAASTKDATAATMGYTAALQRDNGIIAENVRAHTAEQIAKSNAASAAQKLGLGLDVLTAAAMGNKDAQSKVNGVLDEYDAKARDANGTLREMGGINVEQIKKNHEMQSSVKTIRDELGNQNGALMSAVEYQKRFDEAMGKTNSTAGTQAGQISTMASLYGVSNGMYDAAMSAQDKAKASTEAQTLAMQLQNDAAGLLKQAWDVLNGTTVSLEQAQTRSAASTNAVTKSFQGNGVAIAGTTEAAIANQQALQNKVLADQAMAEAVAKSTGKTEDGTKAFAAAKTQLENNLRAQGLLTEEVQAYITKLYNVPASVPKTKIEVDTAFAEQQLAALTRNREVRINAIVTRSELPDLNGDASGSGRMGTYARGGMVNYLASGGFPQFKPIGTDTVPAMLTPGEIVIKKSSVDSIGAGKLLHANETGRLPEGGNTFNIYDTSGNPVSTAYTTARVLAARAV